MVIAIDVPPFCTDLVNASWFSRISRVGFEPRRNWEIF